MIEVTEAQINGVLGSNWASGDVATDVMIANSWLNSRIKGYIPTPTPDPIVRAAAFIAKDADSGLFNQSKEREVTSEMAKAGSVQVQTNYTEGSTDLTAGEYQALILIGPWVSNVGCTFLWRV
ncbi:hypothetical protein LMG33818_000891 [Halomonadaceae bacterium LMG 33818]|uniref:hypothetical protein n=1 Tax=Cernens ardua TaxID=3402176 RepID=UPI003EDC9F7F